MGQFWLVIANSSQVRIFEGGSPTGSLTEIWEAFNDAAQKREQDLVTDRQGRRHDVGFAQKSAMERDAMNHELTQFARDVAQHLEQSRIAGKFDSISIVADPQFLGKLRAEMSSSLQEMVLEEVAKNVQDQTDVAQVQERHLSVLH